MFRGNKLLVVGEFDVRLVKDNGAGFFKHQCDHRSAWEPVCCTIVDPSNFRSGGISAPHIHSKDVPLVAWEHPAISVVGGCECRCDAQRECARHASSARGEQRGPRGGRGSAVDKGGGCDLDVSRDGKIEIGGILVVLGGHSDEFPVS
mmetsp:Transcript_25945/g.29705  ORF Transcript_25945/g.29705 Transcript_25945/m.29705 type:complete len:148 (-) Transcript_25945:1694-2137(-)